MLWEWDFSVVFKHCVESRSIYKNKSSLFFHSGGGLFTLMVSMIGLLATSRRSPVLLRFYAFMLVLAFIVLLGGVACSLRVIFTIHVGVNHSLAIPLIRNYGKDSAATSAWDNLHGNGLWFWPLSQYLQGVPTSFSQNQYFKIFHQNEKFRQTVRRSALLS